MDDYDIYYVDSRKAVRDHRPGGIRPLLPWGSRPTPPTRPVYVPPVAQPAFTAPAPVYSQPPVYQPGPVYSQGPIWYPGMPVGGTMATLFGKLTTGQIVD